MGVDFHVDPAHPLFFVSYSRKATTAHPVREPYEVDAFVLRFFQDLTDHIYELVNLEPGHDPGYLDRTNPGGTLWTKRLLRAVGTCQVFIPLLSSRYGTSRWCAIEWEVFTRRTVVARDSPLDSASQDETAVVPVIWSPIEVHRLPAVISAVQQFEPRGVDDRICASYRLEGIYGLLTMGLEKEYQTVVWKLAQRVATIIHSHRIDPLVLEAADGLGGVFGRSP